MAIRTERFKGEAAVSLSCPGFLAIVFNVPA